MAESNHWQLIPLDTFERPSAPATTAIQQAWSQLRKLFIAEEDDDVNPDEQDFPHYREFDLAPAVAAIDTCWDADEPPSVRFVISAPFSGSGAIFREWAKQNGYQQLEPPSLEQLGQADTDAWWQKQVSERWLIDEFSSFWLRTTEHMQFMRALLPRLLRGELGTGVVVIDSWTYAFLHRAWPLSLPHCYCFAAASPELLKDSGVIASDKRLRNLAAKARGNLGVALALWAVEQDEERSLPRLPSEADDSTAFILYSLLLHHGLKGEYLQMVLPLMAANQLDVQLLRLQQNGIIDLDENKVWRINVYAYPDVREFLAARGFWLDGF
ncbi:hypothetical protein J6I90_07520 [Pseudidiomarina sp. 1APP75-32.1]|uniref:Uncharacterized protein n=1 Tax=Pseudidiomarina terrestris TaxID=2820060 RepID=A0AAW7R0S8_9GAMM|nr:MULTISPECIES: hypothetical protein [unclassified Pseudidiomarina]MDN7124725.1 hypothetical protein [Pseudidiomarina sp. 1APP75-32.1]MDN7129801.1 hypothetical protein [Pseudidiomarina sp. 1APR75-15]